MKRILLTGITGFIGSNIAPILKQHYEVSAPSRKQLDLKDTESVEKYIQNGAFDIIIHTATPNPVKNGKCDSELGQLKDSLQIFMNIYRMRKKCEKVIYIGSGAEYDKARDICKAREEEISDRVPSDDYGFAKYIMNELARKSSNVYNLRIFGCYGPFDHESKFITHAIRCCLKGEGITICQNCYFDYLRVEDLAQIILSFIEKIPAFHDYNIASGKRATLEQIAREICRQMGNDKPLVFLKEGMNKEYTADISRFENEFGQAWQFISLENGIAMQIVHEKKRLIYE